MYVLKPTEVFLDQIDSLSEKEAKLLESKLQMAKTNPFRFKSIKGYDKNLFRIRINKKRIILLLDNKIIIVVCILDRKNNYKDLRNYLNRFRK